jgi:hypothetical protein
MPGSYILPNPSSPATSDALTSLPIRQNFESIQSQINNADGGALNAKSVQEAALADQVNPRLERTLLGYNFVVSGFVLPSSGASLTITVPSGVAYVNGYYVVSTGLTLTVTASNDTYLDIDQNGQFYYTGSNSVTNNAASPTLTSGRVRLAIITSDGSTITSVNQGQTTAVIPISGGIAYSVTDSLGNLIYPTAPFAGLLGYRLDAAAYTPGSSTQVLTGCTMPVIVPAGRRLKLTGVFSGGQSGSSTNAITNAIIKEGSTTLATGQGFVNGSAGYSNGSWPVAVNWVTPSAGLHTYTLTATITNGNVSVNPGAYLAAELV